MTKVCDSRPFLYLLGLIGVMALVACIPLPVGNPTPTVNPLLVDMSIITGQPCVAPCWYGLELGRSTRADVVATARTLPFIDPSEFPEQPTSYWDPKTRETVAATLLSLRCREPKGHPCAGLILVDGVLGTIVLFSYPPLTLGDAVAHLGEPEYVKIYFVPRDITLCNVALIWKRRGIWVAYLNGAASNPDQRQEVRCSDVRGGKGVSPDLPVGQILYQLPDQFADVPIPGGDFPWSGFAKP